MNAGAESHPQTSSARLFAELIDALQAESNALVTHDTVALARAVERKSTLLRALAPQAASLRAEGGLERLAREAAQLNALNGDMTAARATAVRARLEALLAAAGDARTYGADGVTRGGPGGTATRA